MYLIEDLAYRTSGRFEDFFDTPAQNSAAPQALGFDGFFKGAYSYHFHNFWYGFRLDVKRSLLKLLCRWKPFDPNRNWPDLGPRFIKGEQMARAQLMAASASGNATSISDDDFDQEESVLDDKRDLDWAAVLKRTFESFVRGERPNMYGEWIQW